MFMQVNIGKVEIIIQIWYGISQSQRHLGQDYYRVNFFRSILNAKHLHTRWIIINFFSLKCLTINEV